METDSQPPVTPSGNEIAAQPLRSIEKITAIAEHLLPKVQETIGQIATDGLTSESQAWLDRLNDAAEALQTVASLIFDEINEVPPVSDEVLAELRATRPEQPPLLSRVRDEDLLAYAQSNGGVLYMGKAVHDFSANRRLLRSQISRLEKKGILGRKGKSFVVLVDANGNPVESAEPTEPTNRTKQNVHNNNSLDAMLDEMKLGGQRIKPPQRNRYSR